MHEFIAALFFPANPWDTLVVCIAISIILQWLINRIVGPSHSGTYGQVVNREGYIEAAIVAILVGGGFIWSFGRQISMFWGWGW